MTAVRLARAAVPHMKQQGWGRLIFITSISSKQPIEGLITGNTARAGVAGFSKSLSLQLVTHGITSHVVAPGSILTDRTYDLASQFSKNAGITVEEAIKRLEQDIPMKRIGKPAELGALVAFLASERASFITGTTIAVDGGTVRGLL